MEQKSISEIAEGFGLTVEPATGLENETGVRINKGVNSIFVGNEDAAREFLVAYEKNRPGLFEGSVYGYRE
jgi:hypothetical protein